MIEQHSKWFNEGKVVFKEHYDAKKPLIYDEEKFKGIISDIRECALDFIAWHHNRHVNKDAPSPPQVYPKT